MDKKLWRIENDKKNGIFKSVESKKWKLVCKK
jgi:hypothetical protein